MLAKVRGTPCGCGRPEWRVVTEVMRPGDRLLVRCEGGPCQSRLERFPPQLEIDERGGMYVLIDEGDPANWRYLFIPSTD